MRNLHMSARDGREQHHFEMYLHREKLLREKRDRKTLRVGGIAVLCWVLMVFLFWLFR